MPIPPKPPFELPQSEEQIDDPLAREALAWLAHLHSGAEKPEDWTAFETWQAASSEHSRAAAVAKEIWKQLGSSLKPPSKPGMPKLPVVLAAAIGLSALAFVSGVFGPVSSFFADYRSSTGEIRTVTLRDGSSVDLDTGTSFDVSDDGRTITLHTGQVFIDVKSSPGKPFTVIAGDTRAQALGTAFAVRHDAAQSVVLVAESAVRVTQTRSDQTVPRLEAGQMVTAHPARGLGAVQPADVGRLTAWRRGEIAFRDRPLREVVAEVERYRGGKIVVLGKAVESLPVTGNADIGSLDEFLVSLERVLPVTVLRFPGLVLIRPASPS